MCDLWRNTLTETVPLGAIPAQIDHALLNLPPARQLKLYNSGSFFDPQAIPPADYAAIAQRANRFERLIVENHPALIGDACLRFRDLLSGRLEIAMGLETAHPEVLAGLNKRMTLDQFSTAANFLRRNGIDLRVFILVQPPLMPAAEALQWAERSLEFAMEHGATAATLIPTRAGNGAMEALRQWSIAPPALAYPGIRNGVRFASQGGQSLRGSVGAARIMRALPRATRRPAAADESAAGSARSDPMRALRRCKLKRDFDLAIVGAGFGGSLMAMIAHQLGLSVVLLEQGTHPRMAIGESTTPLSNLLLERLSTTYDLPRIAPLAKWGSWQRAYPQIACGLKRGFTFFHQSEERTAGGGEPAR